MCSRLLSYFRGGWNDACVFGAGNMVSAFRFRTHARIVVSTLRLNEVVAAPPDAPDSVHMACGATFYDALDALRPYGRTLKLLPNYSHITLGAALAVPLHGSSGEGPTVGGITTRVRLLDLRDERIKEVIGAEAVKPWLHLTPGSVVYLGATLVAPPATRFVRKRLTDAVPNGAEMRQVFDSLAALASRAQWEARCNLPFTSGLRFVYYMFEEVQSVPMTAASAAAPVAAAASAHGPAKSDHEADSTKLQPAKWAAATHDVARSPVGKMWDSHALIAFGRLCISLHLFTSCELFIAREVFVETMLDLHARCFTGGVASPLWGIFSQPWKVLIRSGGVGTIPNLASAAGGVLCVDFAFIPTPAMITAIGNVLKTHAKGGSMVSAHWGKYVHPSWKPHLGRAGAEPPPL